jgi:ATP-dependent DNA helicase RecG
LARRFAEVGVTTPDDLLAYLPRAYRDWRWPQPIGTLAPGDAVIVGTIARVRERPGRFPLVSADLIDESGSIAAKWFGRRHLFGKLAAGERLFAAGRVTRGARGLVINVTNHRVLRDGETYAGEIVPVYAATKELTSRQIRTTIGKNLPSLIARRVDALPPEIAGKFHFPALADAWRDVHAPADPERVEAGRRRIVFEEFFGIALAAALKRARREAVGGAIAIPLPPGLWAAFCVQLPFVPTAAQERVIERIWTDMARSSPMNRLLQGDVGSGKTLVAAAAVVLAHSAGLQSALMAPTEILAAQHAQKLAPLLLPFGIAVEAVFGSLGLRDRRAANDRIRSGAAALAVGTHALLTESVEFARLGLVIIDEQHRFGVAQRARLRGKAAAPHTLYMTATPIPRTLAQTRYADLDLSIIDELPPGRTPIETYVLRESRKPQAYEFVRKNVELGRQAYIVAPAIDASESALTGALHEAEHIRADVLPELRVDVLHGKLAARDKDAVMARFNRGETDVLVATTVVEVGVDVPNASVMVILDAQRYGLAQLHQLRGRVGRGIERSFCILIAPDDAGDVERLEILAATTDGFTIAEEDLRLRREGEFAGTAQAGAVTGTIGNIVADFEFYMRAKAEADTIVAGDPELRAPAHRALPALVDSVAAARALLVTS